MVSYLSCSFTTKQCTHTADQLRVPVRLTIHIGLEFQKCNFIYEPQNDSD